MSVGSSREVLGDVEPVPRGEARNAELREHLQAQSNELKQQVTQREGIQLEAAKNDDKAKTTGALARVRNFLQGK